jgi:hypothetical protein
MLQEFPDIGQYLQKVIAYNRSTDTLKDNMPLEICYRNGWLQAELSAEGKTVYIFPTKLHQRYGLSSVHC